MTTSTTLRRAHDVSNGVLSTGGATRAAHESHTGGVRAGYRREQRRAFLPALHGRPFVRLEIVRFVMVLRTVVKLACSFCMPEHAGHAPCVLRSAVVSSIDSDSTAIKASHRGASIGRIGVYIYHYVYVHSFLIVQTFINWRMHTIGRKCIKSGVNCILYTPHI